MAPHLFSRQEKRAITLNHYVAGSLIAGAIIFVVLLCLRLCFILYRRSRANEKWTVETLPVRVSIAAETNPPSTSCSRPRISITIPEKPIIREPWLSDEAGVSLESIPSPTSPTSSTRSLHALPRPHSISARLRHSRASSGFSGYALYPHYRLPPGPSSRLSLASFLSPSRARPVHQPFESTLPDELAVRRGEYITVIRTFDDGWCVVAKDMSRSSRASFLSFGMKTNGDNVEIGIVPSWVFAEPLEGVASMRPFRSTSLNALHLGQNPGYARDTVTSAYLF